MIRHESDNAWKIVLDTYLPQFMAFCMPIMNKLIDWSKGWIALDKELSKITKETDVGKRLVDKLYKIYLKTGEEKWILIHIEVQSQRDSRFSQRMFTYYYRLFDKYQRNIISCAVLCDNNHRWRPDCFETNFGGTNLRFNYLTIKIIDYLSKKDVLEQSDNIFATVVLAQLSAMQSSKKSDEQRKQTKFTLSRYLYDKKGFTRRDVLNLYTFIDFMICLPQELELEYLQEIYEFEESKNMRYITSAERFGMEIGMKKGIEKVAKRMLENKITLVSVAENTGLPLERVKELSESMEQDVESC